MSTILNLLRLGRNLRDLDNLFHEFDCFTDGRRKEE